MLITFDYNPETNEYKPLKQEIIKDKKNDPLIKKAKEAEESEEAQITLTDNKYILNKKAAELLQVEPDDRLDIKYQLIDNMKFPIIGKDTIWKTKSGNKLTKQLSVSCRGTANSLLSEFGNIFNLTKWKGHEGLYLMLGNKDFESSEDIDITESEEPQTDIQEDSFENIDIDENDFELNDLFE